MKMNTDNIKSKFSPITVRFTREFLVGADWNDKLTSETDNDKVYEDLENEFFFNYSSTYVFPQSD